MSDKLQFVAAFRSITLRGVNDKLKFVGHSRMNEIYYYPKRINCTNRHRAVISVFNRRSERGHRPRGWWPACLSWCLPLKKLTPGHDYRATHYRVRTNPGSRPSDHADRGGGIDRGPQVRGRRHDLWLSRRSGTSYL